eukprot:Em1142g1a
MDTKILNEIPSEDYKDKAKKSGTTARGIEEAVIVAWSEYVLNMKDGRLATIDDSSVWIDLSKLLLFVLGLCKCFQLRIDTRNEHIIEMTVSSKPSGAGHAPCHFNVLPDHNARRPPIGSGGFQKKLKYSLALVIVGRTKAVKSVHVPQCIGTWYAFTPYITAPAPWRAVLNSFYPLHQGFKLSVHAGRLLNYLRNTSDVYAIHVRMVANFASHSASSWNKAACNSIRVFRSGDRSSRRIETWELEKDLEVSSSEELSPGSVPEPTPCIANVESERVRTDTDEDEEVEGGHGAKVKLHGEQESFSLVVSISKRLLEGHKISGPVQKFGIGEHGPLYLPALERSKKKLSKHRRKRELDISEIEPIGKESKKIKIISQPCFCSGSSSDGEGTHLSHDCNAKQRVELKAAEPSLKSDKKVGSLSKGFSHKTKIKKSNTAPSHKVSDTLPPPTVPIGSDYICPQCEQHDDGTPMICCDSCDEWLHWWVKVRE